MSLPEALRERVLAAALEAPSPTRRQVRRRAKALLLASALVAVAALWGLGGLEHGSARPLGVTLALAAGWLLGTLFLVRLALARQGSTLARTSAVTAGSAMGAPFVLFAWMQLFYGTYPEPFARVGLRCLALMLVIAAGPLAAFLSSRRGVEPRRPSSLGAAGGAACGAWAGTVVNLWCPLTEPKHALVGHVAPLVLLIGFGALIGPRWLGISRPIGR